MKEHTTSDTARHESTRAGLLLEEGFRLMRSASSFQQNQAGPVSASTSCHQTCHHADEKGESNSTCRPDQIENNVFGVQLGQALNAFQAACEAPDATEDIRSKAQTAIALIRQIHSFVNTDLMNP